MNNSLLLTIVIPHYNNNDSLPFLLESIKKQSFINYEVIVVDDCSETDCSSLIQQYAAKKMRIRLIQNETRLYTLQTRLVGVDAAQGKYIYFADADDLLWGTSALEHHMKLAVENDADIVHFNMVMTTGAKTDFLQETVPYASKLSGKKIFETFVSHNLLPPNVYIKIYSKRLFEKVAPIIKDTGHSILYYEDLFLTSLLLFYAESYIGSNRIGYQYFYRDRSAIKSFGRLRTLYIIATKILPIFVEEGTQRPCTLDFFMQGLISRMQLSLKKALAYKSQERMLYHNASTFNKKICIPLKNGDFYFKTSALVKRYKKTFLNDTKKTTPIQRKIYSIKAKLSTFFFKLQLSRGKKVESIDIGLRNKEFDMDNTVINILNNQFQLITPASKNSLFLEIESHDVEKLFRLLQNIVQHEIYNITIRVPDFFRINKLTYILAQFLTSKRYFEVIIKSNASSFRLKCIILDNFSSIINPKYNIDSAKNIRIGVI